MNHTKTEPSVRRSPLTWVPTVYFAMGLPFIIVNMVSTLMFRGLGIDARASPCGPRSSSSRGRSSPSGAP